MKITKILTAAITSVMVGVSCLAFVACGTQHENPDGEGVKVTEDTDFESLVSETVDEDGWKKAFENAFTDCTIKYIQEERERTAYMKFDTVDGRLITEYEYTELDDGEIYFYDKYWYERDGETVYMYSNIDMETGEPTDTYEKHDIYAEMGGQNDYMNDEVIDNWYMSYKMLCPDFGEFFEKFTYDSEKGAYIFSGSETNYIETNSIMEYWSAAYTDASVKIINGKLAYACVTILNNPSNEVYFYDYNNTTITLPV